MRALSPGRMAQLILAETMGAVLGGLAFTLLFGFGSGLLLGGLGSGFDGLLILVLAAALGAGVGAGVGVAAAGRSFGERGSMALSIVCGVISTALVALAVILAGLNLRDSPPLAILAILLVAISATVGYNVRHQ